MSAKHEWLNLLDISGPFLAVPVLREVFPQGLEELDSSRAKRLRSAYEEWRDAVDGDDTDRDELHAAWVDEVLRTALEADDSLLKPGKDVPASVVALPEHDTTITPDLVFIDPTHDGAVLAPVHVFPPDTDLSASMKFGGLSCSPGDRMAMHLRALNVPFGIVTNGERWMLVHAPAGQVATFASWYARIWGQEPATLRAFVSLLGVRRFFAPEQDRLPALFERSLKHQDEVTDALGDQVRRAIEVLVQALDRADQDRNRELLRDVKPQELYEAGLTVMMRLVFLLAAEERGLLLLGEPRYDSFYAVSTLRMQLRAESDEILERRRSAWSRLLAVFRAVFGGIDHPTLRLPAMGGSLFDPDRFPFLEGRLKGTSWRQYRAEPLPIDDRTVLLLLEAIQTFEGRTLSYRALDVEQIGHVYEGLLERTVARVEDVTLELEAGASAKDARVTLGELESARLDGKTAVVKLFVERSKRSQSAIEKELAAEVEPQQSARLLSVCRGDVKLRDRLEPYLRLLRTDPWGYPLVHPKGAFVVVLGTDRRETGTHYTPKSLTERIVEETLTPLVYEGPANGAPRAEWKLKPPEQILNLKVCDPAMGSGAFLVQACRFLSARLVEAWTIEEAAGRVVDLTGQVHEPRTSVETMPPGVEVRAEHARRIVAERCLYGVDLNPLAVELAKLSLWLITLSKGRPFGFLDHNLRCGDSLLGISRLEQLTELSLDPTATKQGRLFGKAIERAVAEAVELRRKLHEIPIRDIRDVEAMATLDADARKKLEAAELLADAFIGVVLTAEGADVVETRLAALAAEADRVVKGEARAAEALSKRAIADLSKDSASAEPRSPFHWPLEFPEIFSRSHPGFDALVLNPPFMGGTKISGRHGGAYLRHLKAHFRSRQNTDLCAYFVQRVLAICSMSGTFGFLATKTIAQADTREASLDIVVEEGTIYFALTSVPWPGTASVMVSIMAASRAVSRVRPVLDDHVVDHIDAFLSSESLFASKPQKLATPVLSFKGVTVVGTDGFCVSTEQEKQYLLADPANQAVIRPFLGGADIMKNIGSVPIRTIIDFADMPIEEAKRYAAPFQHVEHNVRPLRERVNRRAHRERWWQYGDVRQGMRKAIAGLDRVLVSGQTVKYLAFVWCPTTWVFDQKCVVVATDDDAHFALLNSALFDAWTRALCATLGETLSFAPSDSFDTFAWPDHLDGLDSLGARLDEARMAASAACDRCLTETYNAFHDQRVQADQRILTLRDLHREVDIAVARAYGWADLDLGHGFHAVPYLPANDRERFTISEPARLEVLRRLGELNRQRYDEEKAATPAVKSRASKSRAKAVPAGQGAFAVPEAGPKTFKTKAAATAKKTSTLRTR